MMSVVVEESCCIMSSALEVETMSSRACTSASSCSQTAEIAMLHLNVA